MIQSDRWSGRDGFLQIYYIFESTLYFTLGRSRMWFASKRSSSKLLEYLRISSGTTPREQWRLSTASTWRLQPLKNAPGMHLNIMNECTCYHKSLLTLHCLCCFFPHIKLTLFWTPFQTTRTLINRNVSQSCEQTQNKTRFFHDFFPRENETVIIARLTHSRMNEG